MTDFIYGTLEAIGFSHPLHPALTHIPMGMVIGCFLFSLVAFLGKNTAYLKTALHCSIVAIIFIIPTVAAGILDWMHFYGSTWSFFIILKFILACVLTLLLALSIRVNMSGGNSKQLLILYTLCLACAAGLGFSGGEIVYGG
ncbi:DUF2231 domain-containing protein [Desulfogranum japonicum]|uniref:DUF2231 domain-containing protein n=1 Tax=Desulfogranum japonicum TaxID=231447 RepID=UPI00041A3E9E|nr:DUF2231 domain-containing protein [Desulfogranum japonicum]